MPRNLRKTTITTYSRSTQVMIPASSTASIKRVVATTYEWYFLDANNKWIKYGNKDSSNEGTVASITSDDIEKTYLVDEFGSVNFFTHNFLYSLKLETMEQINLTTKKVRPVHRRPVKKVGRKPTEKGENKFSVPGTKLSISQTDMGSLIKVLKALAEVVKLLNGNETKSMVDDKKPIPIECGEEQLQPTCTIWSVPAFWDAMNDGEVLKLVTLVSSSQEYKDVTDLFTPSSLLTKVVSIKRVQNPYLWVPYKIRQRELSIRYGGQIHLNIQKLFHGTKEEHMMSICRENFDWRLHGSNGRESFGMGTYFSNSFAVSHGYSPPNSYGHRFMFLADVIVGNVTQGNSSMARPPKNVTTGESYDTTVDDVNAPQKFVKYDKQESYPMYLIEYW